MVTARELKDVLGRYKKAMRPPIGGLRGVSADDMKLNLRLLGEPPHGGNGNNRTRLRRQISRRMTAIRFNNVLCLRKHELMALYTQLLGFARALGGPPTDPNDPRHLPVLNTGAAAPPGLGN